jgi:NADH:ubiquinone oxidoreductase subunit K
MRHNLIILLMSIEMILLACTLLFVYFSSYLNDIVGVVFAMYILTIAAAETSVRVSNFCGILPRSYESFCELFKYD